MKKITIKENSIYEFLSKNISGFIAPPISDSIGSMRIHEMKSCSISFVVNSKSFYIKIDEDKFLVGDQLVFEFNDIGRLTGTKFPVQAKFKIEPYDSVSLELNLIDIVYGK